jgi:hypothetical protein
MHLLKNTPQDEKGNYAKGDKQKYEAEKKLLKVPQLNDEKQSTIIAFNQIADEITRFKKNYKQQIYRANKKNESYEKYTFRDLLKNILVEEADKQEIQARIQFKQSRLAKLKANEKDSLSSGDSIEKLENDIKNLKAKLNESYVFEDLLDEIEHYDDDWRNSEEEQKKNEIEHKEWKNKRGKQMRIERSDKQDTSKNEEYKMTFKDLLEEVINEEVLTEAKISELLQKDAKLLTKSELNQLAKFKYNLSLRGRENRPRPKSTDMTDRGNSFYKRYDEHEKKYRDLEQKIDQKLSAAGHRGGVSISSSSGYYR